MRSDLIETFKIMNGHYNINRNLFFSLMKVVEEDMVRDCLRDDLDLISGSMSFATKSLITGTHYQHAVLIVMILTLSKSTLCWNWNRELYSLWQKPVPTYTSTVYSVGLGEFGNGLYFLLLGRKAEGVQKGEEERS